MILTKFNSNILVSEGPCPTHTIVIGNGRIFYMESIDEETGNILSPQQYLLCFKHIRDSLDNEDKLKGIPILTADLRDNWAKVNSIFKLKLMC